jgi:WXG100 family type VII secretion target
VADYTFNFVMADATVTHMNDVHKKVDQGLSDLHSHVMASIQQWEGSARDAYWAAKGQWDANSQQMNSCFEAARQTLVQIGTNYGTTESRHAMLWNDIAGG